jgi:hypothetical protein
LYDLEQSLKQEVKVILSSLGSIQGSSSTALKTSYMNQKTELIKRLLNSDITKNAKAKVENYMLLKFAEEEEEYRKTNGHIIQPSGEKVKTREVSARIKYAGKMMEQQSKEARRIADMQIRIKEEQNKINVLVEKVAIQSFEYNPAIVEKEIEELLAGAASSSASSSGVPSLSGSISNALGF